MLKKCYPTLFFSVLAICAVAAEPEKVEKVRAGELAEARASWWGFDAKDSTAALQAAISSGVKRLIVDKQATPWIVKPLKICSDQEIFFEEGVEILAKKGEFKAPNDSLFLLSSVSNVTLRGYGATLRMRRSDYDAPPYKKAEWRHTLSIRGSSDIKVLGLTLAESGGDGIYLGSVRGRPSNLNIHIKDVICDKHYRQGISVITAENLLIENVVMRDTAGTPPAAGIDFEPNHARERLKNIVMRNCVTSNNAGDGYEFYLPFMNASSEPISIVIENCKSIGDRTAVRVVSGNSEQEAVGGTLTFKGCEFQGSLRRGIEITRKPAHGMGVIFDHCSMVNSGVDIAIKSDIAFSNRSGDVAPVGGVHFDNFEIVQNSARPWILWLNNMFADQSISGVKGSVTVKCGDKVKKIALTPEWVKAEFPPRFKVHVPRVQADWTSVKVKDSLKGLQSLPPLRLRSRGEYLFHGYAGVEVILIGEQHRVSRKSASTRPLLIKSLDEKTLKKIPMKGFKELVTVKFIPKETGVYRLSVNSGGNSFVLKESSVPVAFDTSVRPVGLIASKGSLYLPVAKGTELFAVTIAGVGESEAVKGSVFSPEGKLVWSKDTITEVDRYTANQGEGREGGLWQVKFERPAKHVFEDFSISAQGVPAIFFIHPQRVWSVREK